MVPEVPVVHVDASDEVRMIPLSPTATNNPLEVVVLLSSLLFLAHEMMMKIKRNMEKMMSRCFTWVPISGLGKPNYTIIWLNLQEQGILLGGCLTL